MIVLEIKELSHSRGTNPFFFNLKKRKSLNRCRVGSGQPEPSRCPRSTQNGFLALPDTQFGCMHAAAAPTVRSSVREWLIRSQSDSRFGLLHPRKSRNPCTPKTTELFKGRKGNLAENSGFHEKRGFCTSDANVQRASFCIYFITVCLPKIGTFGFEKTCSCSYNCSAAIS